MPLDVVSVLDLAGPDLESRADVEIGTLMSPPISSNVGALPKGMLAGFGSASGGAAECGGAGVGGATGVSRGADEAAAGAAAITGSGL